MLWKSLMTEARALSSSSMIMPLDKREWKRTLDRRRSQWLEMLGLLPLPARGPLSARIAGMVELDGLVIEKLHFQPLPGAYIPGNLYRPAKPGKPLPAVLYLCGHSKEGKAAPNYQAHGRWFGRHGYACLVLDPIQVGEGQGFHHGVYSKNRFDWFSRGYTPAGVEVWNAMRALDYLQSRPEVDGKRLGVTGISGGGAMSWFLAAADERVACAAPVCQTGSIEQHAVDRTIDGHCDCAYWTNFHRWCTPDIGALIAPRPLLVAAGDDDVIWRPHAFHDVFIRIKRQYEILGAGGNCGFVEDLHQHGYTPLLRKTVFAWFDKRLRGVDAPPADDVDDSMMSERRLSVYNGKPPKSDRMRGVDEVFVKLGPDAPPRLAGRKIGEDAAAALSELKRLTFSRTVPAAAPRMLEARDAGRSGGTRWITFLFETDDGIELKAHFSEPYPAGSKSAGPLLATFARPDAENVIVQRPPAAPGVSALSVEARNIGATALGPGALKTARRLYTLLGQTLPERQTHDLLLALRLLLTLRPELAPAAVYGEGRMAPHAIYAGLLSGMIGEIVLQNPPESHRFPETAEFLGVLKVGDLPRNLALAHPKPVTFVGGIPKGYRPAREFYAKLGAGGVFRTVARLEDWTPANGLYRV